MSFFVLFGLSRFFWDFPDLRGAGMVRGFSRFVLFLFLSLLRALAGNSPERVRDTIWTFPERSGKHPGVETPRFSFSQEGHNRIFSIPGPSGCIIPQKGPIHMRPANWFINPTQAHNPFVCFLNLFALILVGTSHWILTNYVRLSH